jgi:hypothetical protein
MVAFSNVATILTAITLQKNAQNAGTDFSAGVKWQTDVQITVVRFRQILDSFATIDIL